MIALDLYCGAGGACRGLERARFRVLGVDLEPQPHTAEAAFICFEELNLPIEFIRGFDLFGRARRAKRTRRLRPRTTPSATWI